MLQTNMLQAEKTRGPQTSPGYSDDAGSGGIGELVNFALGFLRRQYLVIILTAVFAITSCIIYLRITPPTYTARVQVLLANPRAEFVQQQSILSEPAFDLRPDRDPDPAAQIERARDLGHHSAQPCQ